MTIQDLYNIYLQHPVICTDTRKITQGCLFFALKGDTFDGNGFAQMALEKGASFAIIDNAQYQQNDRYLLFDDTLDTLQQLAKHHRQQLTIPVIGITGTNGKTTTKELMRSVLSKKFSTYATEGNLNNHIGVPLTLLSIPPATEIAIIEMGANHQKEISFLSSLAQPAIGLITNVGKAHLEGFGGFEGVKKAKGELYEYLRDTGGTIFIDEGNPFLMEMSKALNLKKIVYYGKESSGTKGNIIESDPFLSIEWEAAGKQGTINTQLTGTYNLSNILAAIAIASHMGLTAEEINTGISSYQPGNNRSQIKHTESNILICDYYNANPSSMAAAIENFGSISADNKIMILGDMFELGDESAAEHAAILKKAGSVNAARIFIGKEFSKLRDNSGEFFETTSGAYDAIAKKPHKNATILIKGSRGMKLEQLTDIL